MFLTSSQLLPVGAVVYASALIVLKPINAELLEILKRTKAPGAARVAALMTPKMHGERS